MSKRPKTSLIIAILGLCLPWAAHAAHPLQTEDTGTQGEGNVELENGFQRSRGPGSGRDFVYQPQVSYGLAPALDLMVQPSWVRHRGSGETRTLSDWGDTNLDFKWRFFGRAPLSLAVRAGVTLATSGQGLGNPHGKTTGHALLAATWDIAPLTVHANLGVTQNPGGTGQRRTLGQASAAVMWAVSETLVLTADGGTGSNPDPAHKSRPGQLLAGAIYTLRPGLDVDVGWQRSFGSGPVRRDLLAGLTWRFSP